MKKKTKIIGTVSALAVSMAMLTGGVLAASSVSLSVNSTVSFEASGVYVMAEGSVLRGASTSSLSALEESDRPESDVTVGASYTYKGHSYTPTSASDDTPNGGVSTSNMLSWTVGTVEFTESETVIRYQIEFTNYSEFPITVSVIDNSETFEGVTPSVIGSTLEIAASESDIYSLTLTLDSVASSLSYDLSLNVNVSQDIITPDEYVAPIFTTVSHASGSDWSGGYVSFSAPEYATSVEYEYKYRENGSSTGNWLDGSSSVIENLSEISFSGSEYTFYFHVPDEWGNSGTGGGYFQIRMRFVDADGATGPWNSWTEGSYGWSCLTGDTLITMSDGKKKRLKDLKKGDKVLGVDPETGELVATEVTATDTDEVKFKDEYTIWYLSDGTKIKTVNKHRFYNVREKKMMFMEEWQIGDEFVKEDGTKVKLEKKRTIHRRVRHFTLNTTTETYFANGMLSGNYHTKPMASETFKFMK